MSLRVGTVVAVLWLSVSVGVSRSLIWLPEDLLTRIL